MAKVKITNFAQVLRLLDTLTDGEKATLRDVLRPAPAPRKKVVKKVKNEASATPLLDTELSNGIAPLTERSEICTACGNTADYQDHFKPSPHYHPFESSSSAKSAAKKSSSRKSGEQNSTANTEADAESVMAASSAGS